MNGMSLKRVARCFIAAFCFQVFTAWGQDDDSLSWLFENTASGTPSQHAVDSPAAANDHAITSPAPSPRQAVNLEGMQVLTEQGETPKEKTVTYYFIFREKPSSYFYESKLEEKKIVFEFNDVKKSAVLIPVAAEPPIENISLEERTIDINKELKGLQPEYHSQVKVIFSVRAMPRIQVNDEYSIISFSYRWSDHNANAHTYIAENRSPKITVWSSAAVAGIGGGLLTYYFLRPKSKKTADGGDDLISIDDLPGHESEKP